MLIERLYDKQHDAAIALTHSSVRSMFVCLWMLEPIYAGRPRFCHEYMERRIHALQGACEDVYMTFAHRVFNGVRRETYQDMQYALYAREATLCFWPRLLIQSLVPRMRVKNASILRKAYLQIPLPKQVVHIIRSHGASPPTEPARNQASVDWLESVLLYQGDHPHKPHEIVSAIGSATGHCAWDAALQYIIPRIRQADDAYALSWRA